VPPPLEPLVLDPLAAELLLEEEGEEPELHAAAIAAASTTVARTKGADFIAAFSSAAPRSPSENGRSEPAAKARARAHPPGKMVFRSSSYVGPSAPVAPSVLVSPVMNAVPSSSATG